MVCEICGDKTGFVSWTEGYGEGKRACWDCYWKINKTKKMTYEEERTKYENMKVGVKVRQLDTKNQRTVVHKAFVEKYKVIIAIMDIMVVTMLIANFGAVIITNALVVKAVPNKTFMEANSAQSELNNYKQHPEGEAFMRALLYQTLLWAVLLFGYISTRMLMYTHKELWITLFILIFYAYLIYFDFFNDLGYMIGKALWGV